MIEGECHSIQHGSYEPQFKKQSDSADSDLYKQQESGGSRLAIHVAPSRFVGTSHERSKQWY